MSVDEPEDAEGREEQTGDFPERTARRSVPTFGSELLRGFAGAPHAVVPAFRRAGTA